MEMERMNNDEGNISLNDCDICGEAHTTLICPQLKNTVIISDSVAPSRTILTLPSNLRIRYPSPKEEKDGKLLTITAREKIRRGTRFGPVEAPLVTQLTQQPQFLLKQMKQDGSCSFLDTTSHDKCNWMCLIQPAETLEQQNLIAYQIEQEIYFGAMRDIRFHEELRVWYSPFYAKKLGISVQLPSTGAAIKPRKGKSKELNKDSTPQFPLTNSPPMEEINTNNPYQLRVRNRGKRRKKYEDFVSINDDGEEVNEKEKADEREWSCSICGESYQHQTTFAKHLLNHYDPKQESKTFVSLPQHRCHFCQTLFSDVESLHQHYVDQHQENFMMEKTVIESLDANISDTDAATILLEIEANCDKSEDHQTIAMQIINSNNIQSTSEIGEIPTIHIETPVSKDMISVPSNEQPDANAVLHIFSCDICKLDFEDKAQLFIHISKHIHDTDEEFDQDDEEEHACVFCQKLFVNKRLLKAHQDQHIGTHSCVDCGQSYASKELLKAHTCSSRKSTDNTVTCQICQKSFTKLKYLEKHIPLHTGSNSCPICGKWLRSADSLSNHLRICGQSTKDLDEGGYAVCPLCKATFLTLKEFRQHMFQHRHAFACKTCGARFRNKINLTNHTCSEISNLECDICTRKFDDVASLNQHKESSHRGGTHFKCDKCEATFNYKELLENHECTNSTVRKKGRKAKCSSLLPLECSNCGSLFSSKSSLNIHRRLHGDKLFSCEICGKRFHRKDLMMDHWAGHGEAAIPCPLCNKKFKTKKSLDVHMSIHDGVKRFTCETCGKQFFQKGNLLKHAEIHNPSRKYACDRCPKSFSTKEYLAIHTVEHTKGRAFACEICGKSFVKDHQLRSHQRNFHANVSFVCSLCGLNVKFKHSLKRHLRKKHMDKNELWCNPEHLEAMMVPGESEKEVTDINLEKREDEEGESEVVLAVSGIGSEALQQALVSGAARIQQGSAPNTIEITLPVQENETLQDDAIQETCMAHDENSLATAHIIQLPIASNIQCEKADEESNCRVEEDKTEEFHITLGSEIDTEIGTQIALNNEDQQILAAGGEVLLVNGAILKQGSIDDDKVFFYVLNSSDSCMEAAFPP